MELRYVPCLLKNFSTISLIQHPSIFTTDLLILQPHGCLSIRPLINQGSLRDWINDTKPRLNYLKKSLKTSKSRNFDLNTIRSVGFQILSALKFLHDKNAAHGKRILEKFPKNFGINSDAIWFHSG